MPVEERKNPVKVGEFIVGGLYRTNKPFSSRDFQMDAHSRWLLYLGKSSAFDYRIVVYVFSSTTQLHHFSEGGDKEKSNHRKYKQGQFGFTEDCAICFDDIIDYLTEKELESYEPVYVSAFDENELRQVFDKINRSDKVKHIEKIDIRNNLSNIGVAGLSSPVRKRR